MINVDKEKCIGCMNCEEVCPKVFEIKEGKAKVKKGQENSELPCAKEAADMCPVEAIKSTKTAQQSDNINCKGD